MAAVEVTRVSKNYAAAVAVAVAALVTCFLICDDFFVEMNFLNKNINTINIYIYICSTCKYDKIEINLITLEKKIKRGISAC